MSERKVAIRLGTDGSAEVKQDLKGIGDTGKQALDGVGAAGDAAAKRVVNAFDRATADIEAAQRRQASAAAKLAAIQPQTATQFRINESAGTGYGDYEGSAKRSAAAFRELIAEQERMEAKAKAIAASLNPLAVAEDRYNQELAETARLQREGLLTAEQAEAHQRRLTQAFEEEKRALDQAQQSAGRMQNGARNLGFQIQDVSTQLAAGTRPMQVFSQQGGQVVQALDDMTGGGNKFLQFLGGPWGAVLMAGVSLLGSFIFAQQDAKDATDGHTNAAKDLTDALDDLDRATRQITMSAQAEARAQFNAAQQTLNKASAVREETSAKLQQAIALQKAAKIGAQSGEPGSEGVSLALPFVDRNVTQLEALLQKNQQDVERAVTGLRAKAIPIYQQVVREGLDPAAAAAGRYDRAVDKLNARLAKGEIAGEAYRNEYRQLTEQRDREVAAAQKSEAAARRHGDANREAAKAARDAARDQRELEQSLKSIVREFNPAAAAAGDYADKLAQIAKLKQAGLLSPLAAAIYGAQAESDYARAGLDRAGKRQLADGRTVEQYLDQAGGEPLIKDEAVKRALDGLDVLGAKAALFQGQMLDLRSVGTEALQAILDVRRLDDFGRVGSLVLDTLKRKFLELALVNPLTNLLGGGMGGNPLPTLFGLFKGGRAAGDAHFGGGLAVLGEFGPELAALPRGTRITPAAQTRRMMEAANDRGSATNIYDLRGAVVYEDLMRKIEQSADSAAVRGAAGGAIMGQAQLRRRARFKMA